MKTNYIIGVPLCALAGLLWGTNGIFIKLITHITPIGITTMRLLIAFIPICGVITVQKKWPQIIQSTKQWKILIGMAFLQSITFISAVAGFHLTTVANASILNNTSPLFTPILALLFLKEKTNTKEWIGIGLATIGILWIFSTQKLSFNSQYFIGNILSLGSGLFFTVYIIWTRHLRQTYDTIILLFWTLGLGAIFIFIGGFLSGDSFFLQPDKKDFFALLGLGIIGTFLGHTAFNASLKFIKSSTASTICLLSPLSATIYAIIILNEWPTKTTMIGLILTLIGIFLITNAQPSTPPATAASKSVPDLL